MGRTRRDRQDAITGDLKAAHGGPPRLRFGLWNKLKILLLANIIPLLLAAWLGWQWHQGRVAFRTEAFDSKAALALAVLLGCCLFIGLSSWIVMPIMRWVRDYPAWHYRKRSPALWAVPAALGYLLWVLAWCLIAICAVVVVALIITALWVMAEKVGLVTSGETGGAKGSSQSSQSSL